MDIDLIRKDTIGCSDKIFLNNAGSSLMPEIVVDTVVNYLREEQMFSGYITSGKNAESIHQFYEEAARLINAYPQNMAFTTGSTDGYAKALSSIPFQEGDCIITTNDDYISNQMAFISLQKKKNIKIIWMKNLPDHELDLEDCEKLIKKHCPKLIAVTHIPTNSGLIQNVEGVGRLCRQYDILYLVDACQSVGQMPVDVQKIGCDFLTATGRKFMRGPRGTGFLYVSDKALEQNLSPLFLDMSDAAWIAFNDYELGKTARRFEIWERSNASLLGFKEALKYASAVGLSYIEDYNQKLSEKLRAGLQYKGFTVLDKGNRLSSIVTFCDRNGKIDAIQEVLKENEIYFSVSNKSNALIDFTLKDIDHAIRLSPHYFNMPEEIERVLEVLE
ncbi:aminotransferase class V-fold PLP-dependent enzyme [Chryseobacterium gallinarum]|uniref:Aminotransferase class V-fold PLP-dependent enzyme n=1 Tax=Chryseobacterium gallinarum TaxID=1324352 RepID=A0ABX6KMM9_CHRGL|nr:aminotransferase class V-fold PLP-dependent enzyme [Chryseobacterium gallinarum]QIY89894.1 aminotransferase class V-fold PLP-dependent enzyme [Chryseobacterium gallinarum]